MPRSLARRLHGRAGRPVSLDFRASESRRSADLGNALQLDIPRLHQVLEGWCAEHGPLFTISIAGKRVVVCSDPELRQVALRERPERFRRYRPIEAVISEIGANGVFSAVEVDQAAEGPSLRAFARARAASRLRADRTRSIPPAQPQFSHAHECSRGAAVGQRRTRLRHRGHGSRLISSHCCCGTGVQSRPFGQVAPRRPARLSGPSTT